MKNHTEIRRLIRDCLPHQSSPVWRVRIVDHYEWFIYLNLSLGLSVRFEAKIPIYDKSDFLTLEFFLLARTFFLCSMYVRS